MTQWDQQCLGNAWTWFEDLIPAWHSGLRIQHCNNCGIGHNCRSFLIPGLKTPYVVGHQKKKKGKRKKEIHRHREQISIIGRKVGWGWCTKSVKGIKFMVTHY